MWTTDEVQFLEVCCEQHWTFAEIANELERTTKSVSHKCNNLNMLNGHTLQVLKTHSEYVKELKLKCPTMIPLEDYIKANIAILHKCLKCGKEYSCVPKDKLQGYACIFCAYDNHSGSIPVNKPGITYLVYIQKYNLYKFGITSKTVKERMRDGKINIIDYDLIFERKFNTGTEAIELEKLWKENLKDYLVNTGKLKGGNTETFRV